jgi:AAA15 family ATPase/GTPase
MKIDIINYCQNKGLPSEWRLEGCQLGNINLIVGQNATGKSRILSIIRVITALISGQPDQKSLKYTGQPDQRSLKYNKSRREWKLIFNTDSEENKTIYNLSIAKEKIIKEDFTIGSKVFLERKSSGKGKIWAEKLDFNIDFQIPNDELAVLKKIDTIQHPFFEDIYAWANSCLYYQFGTELGKTSLFNSQFNISDIRSDVDFNDPDQIVPIFKLGENEFKKNFIDIIKSDMSRIRYPLSNVGTETDTFEKSVERLFVEESDLSEKTSQLSMSQGMFRALSLIIQINYSLMANKPSCILIDDIGEGLDFERSSAMIKLLIDKVKNTSVQLVMTTNDRFIMNGVPLEYWSVIERKPGLAKLHNIYNSPQVFEDFKFTGLNNFDFFSTQFYLEGFGEEEEIK